MTISILGSIVAAVVGMGIGFAWYSDALFGKRWREGMGWSGDMSGMDKGGMMGQIVGGLLSQLVMAIFLSFMIQLSGVFSVGQAMTLAFWIWLGFVATIQLGTILWEKKAFSFYLINVLYWLVDLVVMAAILMSI